METDLIKTGFFKREERIKNPGDFKRLFKEGKKVSIPGAKLFYLLEYKQSWVSSNTRIR